MSTTRTVGRCIALALAATMLAAAPATAKDSDVVRRGGCSAATHWKVKAGADDGRIEVEAEVDSDRVGQRWRWRLMHNGTRSAHGSRLTTAPSGSFEVRRLLVNLAGTDTVVFRARNRRTGEVCRGTVRM